MPPFSRYRLGRGVLTPIGGQMVNNIMRRLRLPKLDMIPYMGILRDIEISENDDSQNPPVRF